jgi:hypothetical protein
LHKGGRHEKSKARPADSLSGFGEASNRRIASAASQSFPATKIKIEQDVVLLYFFVF